jgi:hypothetical protein
VEELKKPGHKIRLFFHLATSKVFRLALSFAQQEDRKCRVLGETPADEAGRLLSSMKTAVFLEVIKGSLSKTVHCYVRLSLMVTSFLHSGQVNLFSSRSLLSNSRLS